MNSRLPRLATALVTVVAAAAALQAQSGEKYTARLSMVPAANAAQANNVIGRGAVTATLSGNTLTISGTFEGLPAAATAARLHQGIAKGARGKAIAELTISKAAAGTLSGSVTLTADQAAALKQGRLYVQVHSERGIPPEQGKVQPEVDNSNLWGWLLR